jgi:hypothetical protein
MFTRIELKDFRGFRELTLDGLQRVNLVVGKNNAGKTSLLEAIAILADPMSVADMATLFREEQGAYSRRFYRWLIREAPGVRRAELAARAPGTSRQTALGRSLLAAPSWSQVAQCRNVSHKTGVLADTFVWTTAGQEPLLYRSLSGHHGNPDVLVEAVARAVRQSDGEQRLESLLRSVDPRVRRVRVDVAEDGKALLVDLGLGEMVPLTQAGQGLYRLTGVFAELLGGQPQVCFIDEVENGIHHSILPDIWAGIAEVAQRLGIQVFATTHSFECIEAAHEAFSKRSSYDFSVVQLFRLEDGVQGRVLQRDMIEAGIEGNIDLR